jgi:hypothetical protein
MNVEVNQFDVQIQEWNYLDTLHTTETVSYLVAEAGQWKCTSDGSYYSAGVSEVSGTWSKIDFGYSFDNPVVFSQITSDVQGVPMVTR